eukprot:TRINITY_DN76811_c0_g1_i1.p1 TRINITY_DN76811_c0_g1~~TRINITY_DN76811_c0_g1_i1.p1  ORF type:complete len:208 (-),score=96.63 TRINITY_DN76811_c0_g1_i1:39-662(-)
MKVVAILLLSIVLATAIPNKDIFSIPQKLARDSAVPSEPFTFSWKPCASNNQVVLQQLSVSPDPIVLGQNITVSFAAQLDTTISSGKLSLTIEKKIFGVWTEIPCVDGVGSCNYDDFCSLFDTTKPCDPIFNQYHLECKCPFTAGDYSISPAISIETKNPNLSWLTNGDFYAKGQLFDSNGNNVACYEAYASLASGQFAQYTGAKKN